MNIKERFDAVDDEFLKFERITGDKPSRRPDLCAFLLLDKIIVSGDGLDSDIVEDAKHDQIFLEIDCEQLNAVASDNDILYLARCGIFYDETYDGLSMFV